MLTRTNRIFGAVGCLGAVGFGVTTALGSVQLGIGAVAGVGFATVVLFDLQAALAIWAFGSFFEAIPSLELAVKGATVLVFLAWVAAIVVRPSLLGDVLRSHGRLVGALVALVLWITVSTAWSDRPETGVLLLSWYLAAAVFLIGATSVREERHVRWVALALVGGAVVTALLGLGGTPFGPGLPFAEAAVLEDRLQGGIADPNFFAALLAVGIALAAGLAAVIRGHLARAGLAVTAVVLALGVVATQSRGGMIAIGATAVCAFAVLKGRRVVMVAMLVSLLGIGVLVLSSSPEAYERVTTFDEGGTGRTDIWKVALAVARDNPVAGVGIGNFPVVSPRYVDEVGAIERADLIGEGLVVHNFYLELLAELGVVGLILFLIVVTGALRACWRAARRFEALGERSMASLAMSVFVGSVGILAGGVFLSGSQDERLWLLLALGPAMLALAERRSASSVSVAPPADPLEGPAAAVREPKPVLARS